MNATIVFQSIWDAIKATNEDGSRKYRYIVLKGSSRSSKTRSVLQAFYLYAFEHPNSRMSVWRSTAKDCRDTVGNDMVMVYPIMQNWDLVNFHSTKFIFRFPSKSVIEVTGTDEPNKVHGYQGRVAWFNEPYDISRDTFDQLDMRTEDFIIIDWNPKQGHWIDDIIKDPRCIELHSTFKDNPFCPPEQRTKILSYQPVKRCYIAGVLTEQQARIYDIQSNPLLFTPTQLAELSRCLHNEVVNSANDFNWMVYGLGIKGERPNRIFHWNKITDSEYDKIKVPASHHITCIDWGAVDPWGILDMKLFDGALYLHQRNYKSENVLRGELLPTERAQIDESEEGFVQWYFNRFNIPKSRAIPCDTNRPRKILGLRSIGYDYAIAAIKGTGSIIDGIDGLNSVRVYYTASSTDLEYEQENYSRKVDPYGIVMEEPEDKNNHLIDPARYGYFYFVNLGLIKGL